MVVIYNPNPSERLRYVLEEIFTHRLGMDYVLTHELDVYSATAAACKINYSNEEIAGTQIIPNGIASENNIWIKSPEIGEIDGIQVLFPNTGKLGFDIFSMCFWYLSRMEEWMNPAVDSHGRFVSASSVLSGKVDFDIPVLDLALHYFYRYCEFSIPDPAGIYPTIDIDIAYKYKGKPFIIQAGGCIKSLLNGDIKSASERWKVLNGKLKDPWDTYEYLTNQLKPIATNSRVFFLVGKRGKYDKNISPDHALMQHLIASTSQSIETGLHPSYGSGSVAEQINNEKNKLEQILNKPITRSRQHFLKMSMPDTYHALIKCGILHDYTMGFADNTGFRAGTAKSFRFYDLKEEVTTSLVVHPFCVMDVSLKNYLRLNVDQACNKIDHLKEICATNKLPFCFVFHNESLCNTGEWTEWNRVFEACLN